MFGIGNMKRQFNLLLRSHAELLNKISNIGHQYGLYRKEKYEDGNLFIGGPFHMNVSYEIDLLNRKIDLIMKHLRINIIDVAPRPADMMVVEVTTAEEKRP